MARPPDRRRRGPTLGEPVTEEFVGDRDLTRWSRLGRWLELLAFRASHYASAHAVLVISSAVGAILVLGLTALSAEIYEDVKNSDGLSGLDVPVLNLAVSLRTPTNVAVVQFFTNLGGALELTIITALILVIMMMRWRSWTPLILLLIGVSGSLLMTVAGKDLVERARPPEAYAVPPYETSPSFPSGHTLNSTVIASLVAYLLVLHLASRLSPESSRSSARWSGSWLWASAESSSATTGLPTSSSAGRSDSRGLSWSSPRTGCF